MKKSGNIVSVLILVALVSVGIVAQKQPTPRKISHRQVSSVLQRLDQSTSQLRLRLGTALLKDQDDINSLMPAFDGALSQFRKQFALQTASSADVENILREALAINRFLDRNRLNAGIQTDWVSVRKNLDKLATVYGITWDWSRQTLPPANATEWFPLSDSELEALFRKIDTGSDTFSISISNAFDGSGYDSTRSEGNMNDAVLELKRATNQLRNTFDARQPVTEYVERVLARAAPIDTYMRNTRVTERAQNDWSNLRKDLNTLAGAYGLFTSWPNTRSPAIAIH